MQLNHILRSQDFDRKSIEDLFIKARAAESIIHHGNNRELAGKQMVALFYEPSTRTRLSFELAMGNLGGSWHSTENAREFSSAIKGETLEDSIRVVNALGADVIVLRHDEVGSSERAAAVSNVPIINAGDGPGQHPTQALLDIFTINEELGYIDGITVAFFGDLLNGRTVRSLAYLLAKFSIKKLYFVAPAILQMKSDIIEYLNRHNVTHEAVDNIEAIASEVDVVYTTRLQDERFQEGAKEFREAYEKMRVDERIMKMLSPKAILMHPLPRNDEIAPEVDSDPRAVYFKQVRYGLFMRMALLQTIFSK